MHSTNFIYSLGSLKLGIVRWLCSFWATLYDTQTQTHKHTMLLQEKLPQAFMQIGWMENYFRNPKVSKRLVKFG